VPTSRPFGSELALGSVVPLRCPLSQTEGDSITIGLLNQGIDFLEILRGEPFTKQSIDGNPDGMQAITKSVNTI